MNTAVGADLDVPADLLDRAMQLPLASRGKLGQILIASVAEANATRDLIHSRIAQLVSGEAELVDAEVVLADLERRYAPETKP